MLRIKAKGFMVALGLLMLFVTAQVKAQGISRQEYTGLDQYPSQGIADDASFVGVRAAEFLTIPVGARGIGLGSSYSAVCDDITSIWWNPAGLGFLDHKEVMFTYVDYTLDLSYNYAAAAMPVGNGRFVIGGFFGHFGIPEMEITTIAQPNGTGKYFKAFDFQMGGSVAYNFSDRFTAGLNMKYIHQDMFSNIGGNAFAIDGGAIYHTDLLDREIKFAFSIQNLGTNITMDGPNLIHEAGPQTREGLLPDGYNDYTQDPYAVSKRANRQVKYLTHTYRLPTTVKIALAYNLVTTEKTNFLVSGEMWRNSNIPMSYAFGSELVYNFDIVTSAALRCGWQVKTDEMTDDQDDFGYSYLGDDPTWRGMSFGGGLKRNFGERFITFDYAYRNKGRLSADNYFSVGFGF